jgi:hypothetical protein
MCGRQVFGTKNNVKVSTNGNTHSIPPSERGSPHPDYPAVPETQKSGSENGVDGGTPQSDRPERISVDVVARISTHALREERAFHICKNLIKNVDPDGNHIIRPIDIVRLTSLQGDKSSIVVCIFEHPGGKLSSKSR